jgi:hypothetical protein
MNFAPKPPNEFNDFMTLYYESCRERIPQIQALAAKWSFEDLIPGLSDYDTRFIYQDDMTADDWCHVSQCIGEVHLAICNSHPHWARILEHLPGINLTWEEFTDDQTYYPEYHQWTIYDTVDADRLAQANDYLSAHNWDHRDEFFCLQKFLTYYGPYDREIDPAINLGVFENKYPLHSRFMHYFAPPLQAAVCLASKRMVRGKLESVRKARELFPELEIFDELITVLDRHYEVPELYVEPGLSALETRLFEALKTIAERLPEYVTIIESPSSHTSAAWKESLAAYTPSGSLDYVKLFDSTKWARQMQGRLTFYAHAPEHFDSEWCIGVELGRIHRMFFVVPYSIFWKLKTGQAASDPVDVVEALRGDCLTDLQADCTLAYHRLTSRTWQPADYKKAALEVVAVYEHFYRGLYNLQNEMKKLIRS